MKEILQDLALHHEWASKVLFKRLSSVDSDILNKELNSSFRGINKTIFHLLTAESTWWQRIQLQEHIVLPDNNLSQNFDLMAVEVLRFSAQWIELVNNASESRLLHVFEYRNSKREAFKHPLYQVLLHLFNHQTYHHGQIITMLRQENIDKLPATDFIEFVRRKGKV